MISRVNSVNFKGAEQPQTQNNPGFLAKAKAFANNAADKFVGASGENKDKMLTAASYGAMGGTIITAAGMLLKSKAAKFIGIAAALIASGAGIALNKRTNSEPQVKEMQEPQAIEVPVQTPQEAPVAQAAPIAQEAAPAEAEAQAQAQEEILKAAEALAQGTSAPANVGTTQG